jgi:hypothetical protein
MLGRLDVWRLGRSEGQLGCLDAWTLRGLETWRFDKSEGWLNSDLVDAGL